MAFFAVVKEKFYQYRRQYIHAKLTEIKERNPGSNIDKKIIEPNWWEIYQKLDEILKAVPERTIKMLWKTAELVLEDDNEEEALLREENHRYIDAFFFDMQNETREPDDVRDDFPDENFEIAEEVPELIDVAQVPTQPDFIELQPINQNASNPPVSEFQSPIEPVNYVQMYETPSPYFVSPTRNLNTLHPCRLFRPYSDNNDLFQ